MNRVGLTIKTGKGKGREEKRNYSRKEHQWIDRSQNIAPLTDAKERVKKISIPTVTLVFWDHHRNVFLIESNEIHLHQ